MTGGGKCGMYVGGLGAIYSYSLLKTNDVTQEGDKTCV